MATQSRITLSKIKILKQASEETACFEAYIHFDGHPVCIVTNDGQGGCDRYHPFFSARHDRKGMQAKLEEMGAFAKSLPPITAFGHTFPNSLESVVAALIDEHESTQEVRSLMKSKILYTRTENPGVFQISKKKLATKAGLGAIDPLTNPALMTQFKSVFKVREILNTMPFEDARALYVKHTMPATPAVSIPAEEVPQEGQVTGGPKP